MQQQDEYTVKLDELIDLLHRQRQQLKELSESLDILQKAWEQDNDWPQQSGGSVQINQSIQ